MPFLDPLMRVLARYFPDAGLRTVSHSLHLQELLLIKASAIFFSASWACAFHACM